MPEDKKKFKPQNLSGLIHENSNGGSPQESRESSSPAPSTRHAGTLTSAGGTYKLSAVKDSKGELPTWNSEKKDNKPINRAPSTSQAAKEPSPDGDFNWVEEDDWNPDAISSALSTTADKSGANSNPWAATKVPSASLDLESEIKKLKTQPNSGTARTNSHRSSSASGGGGDGLTRFRINNDDPNLTPRDLMGASRVHSDMRRDEGRSYGGRFDYSHRDDNDDWDWNSRRPANSMRRGAPPFGRHDDAPAPATTPVATSLRPLKSSITKSVPIGDESDDKVNTSTATSSQPDAEKKLTNQKEEMQQARAKALEARLAKERQEEQAKRERLAARLAALDAKNNAKREQEQAERRKQEEAQRQEQARRESKEREAARQEAERRHNDEIKEKAMEESWSARKMAGDNQPLQSMRRKEKAPARDAIKNNLKPSERDNSREPGHHHITIKLPELGNMNPIESPDTVVEKFPTASSWQHWQDSERPGTVRVVLPTL